MKKISTQIRVRYAETDKMGFVYYGNYAQFFEVARTEMFRSIGLRYLDMEDKGIVMPVVKLECDYKKPAFYDDLLTIETWLEEIPKGPRILFQYSVFREKTKELLVNGKTTLVFLDVKKNKIVRCPSYMVEAIEDKLF